MDDEKNKFGGRVRIDYLRLRPLWRRYYWQIIAIVLAVLLLFSLLRQHLPSLPGKTEAVVCQSSSTDNWGGWHLRSGWKLLNGVLLNDGSNGGYNGRPTLVAPASCQPKTADYAVEAKIQVVQSGDNYSGFGINVRGIPSSTDEPGYSTYIDPSSTGGAEISVVGGDVIKSAPFNPGTGFHVYRAEVKGNTITFLIDGSVVLSVVDNRFISAGEVGLWCANAQIELSSFKLVKL
jgi:hypothetical protein